MERRVLVAIVLSFLVLYSYQTFFIKPPTKPAAAKPGQASAAAPTAAVTAPAESSAVGAAAVVLGETMEREIRVETAQVIALITNRGARLKSWRLKQYLDQNGQPLELLANDVSGATLPFTLTVDDDGITRSIGNALYSVTGAPPSGPISSTARITFEFRDAAGLQVVKTITLEPTGYQVGLSATVTSGGRTLPATVAWGPALGDVDSGTGRYAVKARGLLINEKAERLAAADVAKASVHKGEFNFAGVDDHYFASLALNPGASTINYEHLSIPPPAGSKATPRELMAYSIRPDAGGALKFYVGPKDFEQLKAIDETKTFKGTLTRAIDFGMFDVVVVPLLRALNWLNGYVGNYGWAIIILTILINGAMFPLRHKSVVSMRKMQELQPEVKSIQDRYAKFKSSDPEKQKMNQELMALYRDRGVNPASGCIPMLLTFPVLFAFYALLSTAIELRGAPFMGWIHDLSMPDPYYVTPVLMGLSQIWQTRITPQAGADPAQQKMMMFMPVIFMFFFLWAPAGVALYWFVSNIWGIGQTYLTNYMIGPPNVRTVRPAAERRVKRVGASKTEAASREN